MINIGLFYKRFLQWKFTQIRNSKLPQLISHLKNGGYKVFSEYETINSWALDCGNLTSKKIDRECRWKKSDTEYAFEYYAGYGSEVINRILRDSSYEVDASINERYTHYIELIDIELNNRLLHENIVAVRWINYYSCVSCLGVPFENIKKGIFCVDKGYMSTSLYFYYVGEYDYIPRDLSQSILMILEIPKGVKGIFLSASLSERDEYEFLIERGQTILIKEIIYHFNHAGIIIGKIVQ